MSRESEKRGRLQRQQLRAKPRATGNAQFYLMSIVLALALLPGRLLANPWLSMTAAGPVEVLVDSSGLRHIVAADRIDAAWGEGCVDTDAAWVSARLHLLLTSERVLELDDALLSEGSLALAGGTIPYILLWGEDDSVLLNQESRDPTMEDLYKTLLFLHVPQNAKEELAGLDYTERAVLDAYVEGFNDCFHRDEERWAEAFPVIDKYGLRNMDLTAEEVLSRLNYFWAWGQVLEIQLLLKRMNADPDTRPIHLGLPDQDYDGSSNQWYISGQHMLDGKTVHATDPHIPFALAGAYGVTFRSWVGHFAGNGLIGAPGMLLGATTGEEGNVAWSVTASGPDGTDLYEVSTTPDGTSYFNSSGAMELFAEQPQAIGADVFTLRSGQYGKTFFKHPNFDSVLSLKTINEDPIRTFEWSLQMNEVSNMEELKAVLSDADEIPWGLQSLNLMAASNRPDDGTVNESAYYALLGKVPVRAGDSDPQRDYAGVLDASDPANEWLNDYYRVDEMPQSENPAAGYWANCNVSPAVTDPGIGNGFPLSIIYSSENLTTHRQISFETRIESLFEDGPANLGQLKEFATNTQAIHWEMILDVLVESFRVHGDPLAELPPNFEVLPEDEIPLGYRLLSILYQMSLGDGIHADDSHAAALMQGYVHFLRIAATNANDSEVKELSGGGRPQPFTAFSTLESTRLAFQTFFDTADWFLTTYEEPYPELGDIMSHLYFDGNGGLIFDRAPGGAGSFRAIGGLEFIDPETGKLLHWATGGSAFYQLSRLGEPGDVEIHLLKPYTTWNPNEPLGIIMAERFARHEFTDVTIPPAEGDIVKRIDR